MWNIYGSFMIRIIFKIGWPWVTLTHAAFSFQYTVPPWAFVISVSEVKVKTQILNLKPANLKGQLKAIMFSCVHILTFESLSLIFARGSLVNRLEIITFLEARARMLKSTATIFFFSFSIFKFYLYLISSWKQCSEIHLFLIQNNCVLLVLLWLLKD